MWIPYEGEVRLESRISVWRLLLDSEENNHVREKNIDSVNTSEFDLSVVKDIENEPVKGENEIRGQSWLSGLSK